MLHSQYTFLVSCLELPSIIFGDPDIHQPKLLLFMVITKRKIFQCINSPQSQRGSFSKNGSATVYDISSLSIFNIIIIIIIISSRIIIIIIITIIMYSL